MEDKIMLPTITTRRSYKPFFMSDIFGNDFFPEFNQRSTTLPAVNIREDETRFAIDLALPGIDKNDLKIDINEDLLTVSSEKTEKNEVKEENYQRKEFSYSSFSRSFYIPENVKRDNIEANYKDGVLTVSLPKDHEEKAKLNRQIAIS